MSICAAQSSCLQNGRNASTSSWEESIRRGMWLEQAMLKHAHGVLIIFINNCYQVWPASLPRWDFWLLRGARCAGLTGRKAFSLPLLGTTERRASSAVGGPGPWTGGVASVEDLVAALGPRLLWGRGRGQGVDPRHHTGPGGRKTQSLEKLWPFSLPIGNLSR